MTSRPEKGVRGFELDLHVAFAQPLTEEQALSALLVLDGFRVELYRPHPHAIRADPAVADPELADPAMANRPVALDFAGPIPSARLTGPLHDREAVQAGLQALLGAQARFIEVGLRGFLRSAAGQTEWMPWRRNLILPRADTARVAFEPGVKYVLE